MDFRLLGPLEVLDDGRQLVLGGRRPRALLAVLLLHRGEVVSTEQLIDSLYGARRPPGATKSVQAHVSRLRKALASPVLRTSAGGYALQLEPGDLDLDRFDVLVERGRGALAQRDGREASTAFAEALALWRGPPLADFRYEEFAQVAIARLEEQRLAVNEDRIDAELELGRQADVIGELEAVVAEFPLRERPVGQLMLALYRAGRQADALAAFAAARRRLADELGLEPSASLRQLERQILTQDAALELGPERPLALERVPLPGPLVPESPFPFVGRAVELEKLRSLLERARSGEGGLVLLTGEPGAGKTRLVREFAREAAGQGALVLYGVSDAVVRTPYQPLREWLEFLCRVGEPDALRQSLGDEGGRLTRLVPELARAGIPAGDDGEVEPDPHQLQNAATRLLSRLSRAQPLLLALDDLHWADAETLQLLRRLAHTAPECRVLVVAAYRDPGEEITPHLRDALADLSRLDAVSRLTLHGLTADEVGAFVHASADADASPELTSAIGQLTDGTPLLVCELWRDLRESGGVELSDGGARLARPVAELRGPARIRDAVKQRLSQLSVETNRVIELAAVAGPRFEVRVVGRAAGLDRAALAEAVEQACRHGIIEELPAAVPTCRFTHELVRRAVHDPISQVRLPELHLAVGEALEETYASDIARVLPELAHHFTLAASIVGPARAVDYNVRAAEAASTAAAYTEAAARLATALELGIDDPLRRAEVQAELGYLYYEGGRLAESDVLLTASIEAASDLGDRALAARALVHRSNQRLASDPEVSSAEMLPIAEEAIRTFDQLADRRGLAAAEHLFAHALGREGRSSEAVAALERALGHAEAVGDRVVARHVIGRRARQLSEGPTPAGEAIEQLQKLLLDARHDATLDAGLRRSLALVLAMAGRFDEARDQIEASSPAYDLGVQTDFMLQGRWAGGEALEFAGDLAGAEREYAGVFASLRDSRGDVPEARALRMSAQLALLLCDQGRWDEAAGYLAYGEHVDRAEPVRGKIYSHYRFAARGRLAARRGDLSQALHLVGLAVEVVDRSSWLNFRARIWLAFAEVNRAADRPAEADAAVATALALYEQKGNVASAARTRSKQAALAGIDRAVDDL